MINVIGMGYIGLPTALMFSSHGVEVVGTDKNIQRIKALQEGATVFSETGLDALMENAQKNGIRFSQKYYEAEYYIIAVPTPYLKEDKKVDPTYIVQAASEILQIAPKGATIILESTVSPGTVDAYVRPLLNKYGRVSGEDIHLVHAPERIIPGNMIYELLHNSRTIGADDPAVADKVKQLYSVFCQGNIITTDIKTAEMTKVVENTFRDINIAYANELAKICRRDGMDVYEVIRIANMHPRVNVLQPGPGVGGHCISVDPWFLVGSYPDQTRLIRAARETNDSMPEFVFERIISVMEQEGISDIGRVGLYGLTYKEDVDDIRESPTLQMLDVLKQRKRAGLKVYDPYITENIVENQYQSFDEFLSDIDLLVLMVGHTHIIGKIEDIREKAILDTRNMFDRSKIKRLYKL